MYVAVTRVSLDRYGDEWGQEMERIKWNIIMDKIREGTKAILVMDC